MTGTAMLERRHERVPSQRGMSSLEAAVAGAWRALASHRSVQCVVCGADMAPRYGVQALPVGGRCEDCGTELS